MQLTKLYVANWGAIMWFSVSTSRKVRASETNNKGLGACKDDGSIGAIRDYIVS